MERCASKNIKLNAEKFKFKLCVKFMGNIITDNGMRPDPDKVSSITQMPTPTEVPVEVHRNGKLPLAILQKS